MVTGVEGLHAVSASPVNSPTAQMLWRAFSVPPTGLLAALRTWLCIVPGHGLGTEDLFLGVTVHVSVAVAAFRWATVLCRTQIGRLEPPALTCPPHTRNRLASPLTSTLRTPISPVCSQRKDWESKHQAIHKEQVLPCLNTSD